MIDPPSPNRELAEVSLSAASSRLDASLLRYVLLFRSRMNMLALDRELRSMVGERGRLELPAGVTRSNLRYRAEATMQFAVELELARPEVVRWVDGDAQRRQKAIDAAYYQAERWRKGKPPVLGLGQRSSSVPTSMTAGSIAGRRFALYLWARSRLEEEHKARGGGESSSGSAGRLTERRSDAREGMPAWRDAPVRTARDRTWVVDMNRFFRIDGSYRILCSIAAGVADRLQPMVSLEDWRRSAQACADHRGFRLPPPELMDALLIERRAMITPAADGKGAPVWQFNAAGDRGHASREINPPSAQYAQAQIKEIEALEETLADALDLAPGVPPLAWLADVYGLLPTTPAWADVQRAMNAVSAKRSGDVADGEELRTVADFNALLETHVATVVRALRAAAFLGEHERDHSDHPQMRLRRGLRLLAQGLRFPESELTQIERKLTELGKAWAEHAEVQDRHPGTTPWPLHRQSLPGVIDGLARQLEEARSHGRSMRKKRIALFAAWSATRRRLLSLSVSADVGDATFAELQSAASDEGLGQWTALDPRRMTLREWSQLLMAACLGRSKGAAIPSWLAIIALQRLGANALDVQQQERLLFVMESLETRPSDQGLARQAARVDGAWQPGTGGLGTQLLVIKQLGSQAAQWSRPPTLGMVLLATERELEWLVLYAPRLLHALPAPLTLRYEEGSGVHGPLRRALEAALRGAAKKEGLLSRSMRLLQVLLTPDSGRAESMSATDPDDLFDTSDTG